MKKLLEQYLIKFKDNKLGVDEIRDLKFAQEDSVEKKIFWELQEIARQKKIVYDFFEQMRRVPVSPIEWQQRKDEILFLIFQRELTFLPWIMNPDHPKKGIDSDKISSIYHPGDLEEAECCLTESPQYCL